MKTIGCINRVCRELKLPKEFWTKCREVFSKIKGHQLLEGRKENVMAYNIISWVADEHYGAQKRYVVKMKDVKRILNVSTGRPMKADKESTNRWVKLKELVVKTSSEYNQDLR